MAFTQGTPSSGSQETKKKSNFRIGKIYGSDGQIDVSIWNSDKGGVYTILTEKVAVGKDPATGANVYVQKISGELPAIFMNMELTRTFVELENMDPSTLNVSLDTKRGSKMTIIGSPTNVKITIDSQKNGSATVTLDSVSVGATNVHANWKNLVDYVKIGFKKALFGKLDPEEFSAVINESAEDSELPI